MENNKNIEVKVELIEDNIRELTQIGGNFCGQYFKATKEQCDKNFAEKAIKVQAGNNAQLFLNRSVPRIKISGIDILKLEYGQISDGDNRVMPVVIINKDLKKKVGDQVFDQEVTIPLGSKPVFSDVDDEEVLNKALAGETKIFADPVNLAKKVNLRNEVYLAEVRGLITYLKDQENILDQTIKQNNKLAQKYQELRSKAIAAKEGGETIVLNVEA